MKRIIIKEGLELGYKIDTVLKFNETLEVENQEDILIYGKNGAGKTTLLKTIAGIIHPTKGNLDSNLKELKVNYISEDLTFPDDLKLKHIFDSCIEKNRIQEVKKYAEELNLDIKKAWRQLSKGNKQRVRLFIGSYSKQSEKQIQLYDEPLSGLDNKTSTFFTNLWKEQKEVGLYQTGIRIFSMHGEHVKQLNWDQEWEIQGSGGGDISVAVKKPYSKQDYIT